MKRSVLLAAALATTLFASHAAAQRHEEDGGDASEPMTLVTTDQAGAAGQATTTTPELFPLAGQLWLHSLDLTQAEHDAIERAISAPSSWVCNKPGAACTSKAKLGHAQGYDNAILIAIRHMLPWAPTPITVYAQGEGLQYNPELVGHALHNPCRWRASSRIVGAHPARAAAPGPCVPSEGLAPPPEGELETILRWPTAAEVADFQYMAIADECNNVVVTRFAREVSIPSEVETSDSCNMNALSRGPLKLLRHGTTLRVSAFNVDHAPTRGNVVSATFRVDVPSLTTGRHNTPAPILVPDFQRDDIVADCTPSKERALPTPVAGGRPVMPKRPGHVLASQSFVVRPEPIQSGRCRLVFEAPMLSRLRGAPLSLHVLVERVDLPADASARKLVDERWLVSPGPGHEFTIPAISLPGDGEARLRLTVYSDPADAGGSAILFSDALRGVGSARGGADAAPFRREILSAGITTAPLCGGWDLQTLDEVGSCMRAYITIPVMIATFQITRAPWLEKPLLSTSLPGAIGLALVLDSYNPATQHAFPISVQFGGAYQKLSDSANGILAYAGVMASLPVLGTGGTTTSIGILLGAGATYVMDSVGPNEGFKPALFASLVVGAGQVVLHGGAGANPFTH